MYIIGICGAPGAGKDTAAHIIAEALSAEGYVVVVDSFAAPLRAAAQRLLGDDCLEREQKEVPRVVRFRNDDEDFTTAALAAAALIEEGPASYTVGVRLAELLDQYGCLRPQNYGISLKVAPRQLMQWLGTECGRDLFGDSFWVDKLHTRHAGSGTEVVILPDVRFDNEVAGVDYLIGVSGRGAPLSEHRSDAMTRELVRSARAQVDNSGPVERLEFDLQRYLFPDILRCIQHHGQEE